MGSGNSKLEEFYTFPFEQKDLFQGQTKKPKVTFTSSLVNNTECGLHFQGFWGKRGILVQPSPTSDTIGKRKVILSRA